MYTVLGGEKGVVGLCIS